MLNFFPEKLCGVVVVIAREVAPSWVFCAVFLCTFWLSWDLNFLFVFGCDGVSTTLCLLMYFIFYFYFFLRGGLNELNVKSCFYIKLWGGDAEMY